jgi:hypothetical protein
MKEHTQDIVLLSAMTATVVIALAVSLLIASHNHRPPKT